MRPPGFAAPFADVANDPARDPADSGFDRSPRHRVEPLRQRRCGRRRHCRRRRQRLAREVGATSVQADQVVLARELRAREADQELAATQTASALLDRSDSSSSAFVTPTRSTSSVTANSPAAGVSDRSGAPIRT